MRVGDQLCQRPVTRNPELLANVSGLPAAIYGTATP